MTTQTTELSMKLDGRTFRGPVPISTTGHPSALGPVIDPKDRRAFEGNVARSIFAHKLLGPESFGFCRSFCAMSVETVADLLQVARRTVERWESRESQVPAWAMLLVSKMADESSRGRTTTHTGLRQLADDGGRPLEIELDLG